MLRRFRNEPHGNDQKRNHQPPDLKAPKENGHPHQNKEEDVKRDGSEKDGIEKLPSLHATCQSAVPFQNTASKGTGTIATHHREPKELPRPHRISNQRQAPGERPEKKHIEHDKGGGEVALVFRVEDEDHGIEERECRCHDEEENHDDLSPARLLVGVVPGAVRGPEGADVAAAQLGAGALRLALVRARGEVFGEA